MTGARGHGITAPSCFAPSARPSHRNRGLTTASTFMRGGFAMPWPWRLRNGRFGALSTRSTRARSRPMEPSPRVSACAMRSASGPTPSARTTAAGAISNSRSTASRRPSAGIPSRNSASARPITWMLLGWMKLSGPASVGPSSTLPRLRCPPASPAIHSSASRSRSAL